MADNVFSLMPVQATADEVLEDCKGQFDQLLALGWSKDGALVAKATSAMDVKETVYLLETFKHAVIQAGYHIDE